MKKLVILMVVCLGVSAQLAYAQDVLPADNGLATYHTSPRYRESESHPMRVMSYLLHPVGWVMREAVFRPLSYFASSTEQTRSIMGYREPYDYRQPECFSADDSVPDCRSLSPFNYEAPVSNLAQGSADEAAVARDSLREVYLPDVNFDFNVSALSDLGRGQVHRIKDMLDKEPGLKVVLEGHTDFKGSDGYNEKLGMDRSDAVRAELLSLGVAQDRISTVTFGESKPLYAAEDDWARAVNRRVQPHVDSAAPAQAKEAAPANGEGEWKEAQ